MLLVVVVCMLLAIWFEGSEGGGCVVGYGFLCGFDLEYLKLLLKFIIINSINEDE